MEVEFMEVTRSKDPKMSSVKLLSFVVLAVFIVMAGAAKADAESVISYVYQDAQGSADGSSWENAFTNLQAALGAAGDGDQIWVAKGTYYPTDDAVRNKSFQMKNGVAIFGGFAGTEGENFDLNTRNFVMNETILSGDIGIKQDNSDNSYHVVCNSGLNSTAVLDGFTITGGNADYTSPYDRGGGMLNENSSPTLTNVTLLENYAYGEGGGMYNRWSNPTLTHVTFSGNRAAYGGGMYNYFSNLELTDVIFSGNIARGSGGGMLNFYTRSLLTRVTFSGNIAENGSGGGFCDSNGCNSTLIQVTFTNNEAGDSGGGMSATGSPILNQVTFSDNTADHYGGGLHFENSGSPELIDVTFSGNTADYGGGVYNYKSSPALTNVTFSENSARQGSGMYNYSSSNPTLTNVTFSNNGRNVAKSAGGGMYNHNSSPILINVTFNDNSSETGGGIYNYNNSSPILTNVTFRGNSAEAGGGMVNDSSSPILINVTFSGNSAELDGAAMYNYASNPTIINSIFWGNLIGQIYNANESTPTIAYSLIEGYNGDDDNIISSDPMFVSDDDLRLQAGSPAIELVQINPLWRAELPMEEPKT
jgi:predicted outer membrane repeat protein